MAKEVNKEVSNKGTKDTNSVETVVNVRRVTNVTKGGKRFAFSAFVVTGDKNGSIGIAQGKSREVASAISKATNRARKKMTSFPLRDPISTKV